jgi:hypothetical protein
MNFTTMNKCSQNTFTFILNDVYHKEKIQKKTNHHFKELTRQPMVNPYIDNCNTIFKIGEVFIYTIQSYLKMYSNIENYDILQINHIINIYQQSYSKLLYVIHNLHHPTSNEVHHAFLLFQFIIQTRLKTVITNIIYNSLHLFKYFNTSNINYILNALDELSMHDVRLRLNLYIQ